MKKEFLKAMLAEFIGTFFLIFFGCGAIIMETVTGEINALGISITFGIVVMVMIAAVGHISKAQFNPAVSVAFAAIGEQSWGTALIFSVTQIGGAVAASFVLKTLFGNAANLGSTVPKQTSLIAFVVEICITFALMFVITAVATDPKSPGNLAGVMIGATVTAAALWAGPISGASMNPARSFGPALLSGMWAGHWVYWLAPIIGAVLGALAHQALQTQND